MKVYPAVSGVGVVDCQGSFKVKDSRYTCDAQENALNLLFLLNALSFTIYVHRQNSQKK